MTRSGSTTRAAIVLSLITTLLTSTVCAVECPTERVHTPALCHDAEAGDETLPAECCHVGPWVRSAALEDGKIAPPVIGLTMLGVKGPMLASRRASPPARPYVGPDPNHFRTCVLLI